MSYSQFIMAVFAIYVVYYAANILYDAFLKQSKTNTGEEEEIISIGEEEEIPHKVVDEDFETGSYEKKMKKRIWTELCICKWIYWNGSWNTRYSNGTTSC